MNGHNNINSIKIHICEWKGKSWISLGVAVCVCFVWFDTVDILTGGRSAHTSLFAQVELLTHTSQRHTLTQPAPTVLSHHTWDVLTGDATRQSGDRCVSQLLQPWSKCLSLFRCNSFHHLPRCWCLSQPTDDIVWYCYSCSPDETLKATQIATWTFRDPKINTQQKN